MVSQITFEQPSSIKKGNYLMIDDHPCRVIDTSFFKPGKHGSAKHKFIGVDIFTDKKCITVVSSDQTVTSPVVTRDQYTLLNVNCPTGLNNSSNPIPISLMDDYGGVKDDINLPDNELGKRIAKAFDSDKCLILTIQSAIDKEKVISFTEARD
jgi:translation elongation factor IF5A